MQNVGKDPELCIFNFSFFTFHCLGGFVLEGLLVAAVVLNSLILVGIVIGLAIVIRRIGRAVDTAESILSDIHLELPETLRLTQDALKDIDTLAFKAAKVAE